MGNISVKPHHRSRNKKQVRWKAADRPLPPGRPQFNPDLHPLPDVITLCWAPPRKDGGSPIIGYLVEHRRCGSTHWIRSTPFLVSIPEVSLSGLEPGWRYQFRITAENAVGLSIPSETSEPLTVTLQRFAITAPRFTEELHDTVALENEKVEFVVHFMGQPSPKVSWYKDGFEVFSSRRTRIITENDKSILTIHQASLSDEGEIKCTATNRAGHSSTRAILKLEATPSIRLPRQYEEGLLFEIGEPIRLKVTLAGRPAPLVFWFHNNESLKTNDRYDIESDEKYSTLKVNDAQRSDRGFYQVKAVNKLGEDLKTFVVNITDKPSPPGKARVVMTLGRSVTLSWKSPEDDGGCSIGNYIVEYNRVGWDVWLKAATCRQLTTVLGDLIEGSEYKFRVKAESPYGISEPSEESDPIFIPDPQRGILGFKSRAKSQPPDLVSNDFISISYQPKTEPQPHPRSRSSSRTEKHVTISEITDIIPPVRPKRTKSKSAPQTPIASPAIKRRVANANTIDKGMFDRASLARELAYGSPGMKTKRSEDKIDFYSQNPGIFRENDFIQTGNIETNTVPNKKSLFFDKNSLNMKIVNESLFPSTNQNSKESNVKVSKFDDIHYTEEPARPTSPNVSEPFNLKLRDKSPQIDREKVSSNTKITEKADLLNIERKYDRFLNQEQKARSPSPSRIQTVEKFKPSNDNITKPIEKMNTLSPSNIRKFESNGIPKLNNERNNQERHSKSPSPEISPDYLRRERQRSPNKLDFMGSSKDRDDTNSGSTEFMLVLYPDENLTGHKIDSNKGFDFSDISVPPPLSLSAPELGIEPPQFEILRSASSTDIFKALQMQRVFETLAAEENQKQMENEAKNIERDVKTDIPIIQINSKNTELSSFKEVHPISKRRLSGSTLPHQAEHFYRRQSLKNSEIPENKLHKFQLSSTDERDLYKTNDLSDSQKLDEIPINNVQKIRKQRKNLAKREIAIVDEKQWEEESLEDSDELQSLSESNPSDEEFFSRQKIPARNYDEDEPIFHRGPIVLKTDSTDNDDKPFEILTKPCPLPDPSFVPKPILKKRDEIKHIPDKPERKDLERKQQTPIISGFSVEHKQRSSSPRPPSQNVFERRVSKPDNFSTIAESKLENKSTPQSTRQEKPSEEMNAVVDHYGDIVKSYGQKKINKTHLYLDRDELKAAAEQQSNENLEEIEMSVDRLQVPDSKEFEGFENEEKREKTTSRSRTISGSSGDEERSSSPRRGSITHQRRNSGTTDRSRKMTKGSRSVSRSPSKSSTHEGNWSNLKATPNPSGGRKSSPSPQRRTSFSNIQILPPQNRKLKKMRETTTQTLEYGDNLPFPRVPTPEQELMTVEAEIKVRSTIDYITDLSMFIVACWLYLFHNEIYAIPVLLLMVYRQLKQEILKRLPKWMLPKKKRNQKK